MNKDEKKNLLKVARMETLNTKKAVDSEGGSSGGEKLDS